MYDTMTIISAKSNFSEIIYEYSCIYINRFSFNLENFKDAHIKSQCSQHFNAFLEDV